MLEIEISRAEPVQTLQEQGLSLYLHIPFCKTRCSYCDFNTYTNLGHLQGRYTNALCSEIERTLMEVSSGNYNPLQPLPLAGEVALSFSPRPLYSVFFGGGTPSLLAPSQIDRIMSAIRRYSIVTSETEVTVEANPGTLTLEKLRGQRQAGINRLSFGVQTFDDALLRSLGRTHNGAEAVEAFTQARRAGFNNINLDFIYGLPGQTLAGWRATLERAVSLRPEHLSLYALKIEENTAMGRALARGSILPPDDDLEADMYLLALELLGQAGYLQYEISNWALPQTSGSIKSGLSPSPQACRHNLVYWRNQPYIGFGPGAHSSFAGYRYAVISDPLEYVQRLQRGESVILTEEAEEITPQLKLADSVILALRLNEGLEINRIEREFGRSLSTLYPGVIEKLLDWGLLREFSGSDGEPRLGLTDRGKLLSNEVFLRFLPD